MSKVRVALVVFIIVLLALFPLVVKREGMVNLLIMIFLFAVLAQSWNVLAGYAGQINLGHAAFFGLGSLAARLLWMSGAPVLVCLLAAASLPVAFAIVIGVPAFRLRGVYFAVGTLALGEILNVTVGKAFPVISALPGPYLASYELLPRYYLFLGLAILTMGSVCVLVNSRLGLGMMAIREEEEAAESLGVSALRHKLLALCVSALFAGLAGGAFAYYHVSYYYQLPFSPMWTFDSMMIAFVGGAGTVIGPIIGAIFYVIAKEVLAVSLVDVHLIIFGVLFILVVLFLPGGFVEAWGKARHVLGRDARLKLSRLFSDERRVTS